MVAAPATKTAAASSTGAAPATEAHHEIEVEGLEASSWGLSTEAGTTLKAEATADSVQGLEAVPAFTAAGPPATGPREYKVLTSRDKFFDARFDLGRLEEALNHFSRQGWVVKSVMTPHVKGFSGALEETIVVLLER
jgi:hypothetical protein